MLLLYVPTPLTKYREPDTSHIESAVAGICQYIRNGQLIVLESTTYPGTTEEIIVKELQNNGFNVGTEVFVGYSPEREDPGNKKYRIRWFLK